MHSILCILYLIQALLFHATALPQTLPVIRPLAKTNGGLLNASDPTLNNTRFATLQLPEHENFLLIKYKPHTRLPPSYEYLLNTVHVHVIIEKHVWGDEALVGRLYSVRQGHVEFQADDDEHGPYRTLTLGILEEAIRILAVWMRSNRVQLQAFILEGRDGRGPPVGEISIREYE